MCVIVAKPAGAKLPAKKDLERMFEMNPHGCGFACPSKTYHSMDFEDFYNHLIEIPVNEPAIIHFRWATHGSVNLKNTHPFYDKGTDTYFAHNGILSVRPKGDMTDSETAFRKYLVPAIKKYGYNSKELKVSVYSIIGYSKFAFLHNKNVQLFGHFLKHGSCYYSNLRHLPLAEYRY